MRGWRDVAELKKGKASCCFFFLFCLFMLLLFFLLFLFVCAWWCFARGVSRPHSTASAVYLLLQRCLRRFITLEEANTHTQEERKRGGSNPSTNDQKEKNFN